MNYCDLPQNPGAGRNSDTRPVRPRPRRTRAEHHHLDQYALDDLYATDPEPEPRPVQPRPQPATRSPPALMCVTPALMWHPAIRSVTSATTCVTPALMCVTHLDDPEPEHLDPRSRPPHDLDQPEPEPPATPSTNARRSRPDDLAQHDPNKSFCREGTQLLLGSARA